jgi:hypothetical protein
MQNKWRPDDWRNPYGDPPSMGRKASKWYELGADAMLEAIKKDSQYSYSHELRYWAIPDDPQPKMVVTYPEPDCLQKALDLDMFLLAQTPLPHKATKVVDEGYFCHICGQQVSGVWQGVCNYSRRMDLHRGIHFTSGN